MSTSPDKNVSLINTATCAHLVAKEKSDLSPAARPGRLAIASAATYIDAFGVTCTGEGEIINLLPDSVVVKVAGGCYSVAFDDLQPVDDLANNRIDLDGWREILQMVADEPDADAQLLADATAGMPQEWRQTIWQLLSEQVRDRLGQIRNLVQPSFTWMWNG